MALVEEKKAKRLSMTHSIRRTLKGDWSAHNLPSAIPSETSRSSSHTAEKARTLTELLQPTWTQQSTEPTPHADDQPKKPRRFRPRKMLKKMGVTGHLLVETPADYPQSDDPSTGHSALERKKNIDRFYKQGKDLARQFGTSPVTRIEAANMLSHAGWDVDVAMRQLQLLLCSRDGILYDINPRVQLVGAVNSRSTTCYIDSLLMALFGAQHSCDGLLYMRELGNKDANDLLAVCRLLVNYIRAGELIPALLIEEFRGALIKCGWLNEHGQGPLNRYTQQDVNELYMFLMDKLQMPYLAMQVQMVHGADQDEADNRMVTQRVLELSLPDEKEEAKEHEEDPQALELSPNNPFRRIASPPLPARPGAEKPLLLQALLEQYFFDNRVEHLERILKNRDGGASGSSTKVHTNAWSFLSIYPFYTPQNEMGDSEGSSIAADYPEGAPLILPLLIKRYKVDNDGHIQRVNRRVICPMVLDVTNIISSSDPNPFADPKDSGNGRPQDIHRTQTGDPSVPPPPPYPSKVQYRMVLRAAICHKGSTVNSGHYVSYCTRLRLARPDELRQENSKAPPTSKPSAQTLTTTTTHLDVSSSVPDARILDNVVAKTKTLSVNTSLTRMRGSTLSGPKTALFENSSRGDRHWLKHKRGSSWPMNQREATRQAAEASRQKPLPETPGNASPSDSGSSTPTPSLYNVNIHGTAADWENYALTMNLNSSNEFGHLPTIPEHLPPPSVSESNRTSPQISVRNENPPPLRSEKTACAPPAYSQDSATKPQVYLTSDRPNEPNAPTIGEFLRFDDMDISNNRVQYFSTSEGGRKCMEEISRDGYMLFYALQRVELPNEDTRQVQSLGRRVSQQAMDELSSALKQDEQDMSSKRIIETIMRNSGAYEKEQKDPAFFVLADYKDDGQSFEDLAMRWQNVRVSETASPVGPLGGEQQKRRDNRNRLSTDGNGVRRSLSGKGREKKSSDKHSKHDEQCLIM